MAPYDVSPKNALSATTDDGVVTIKKNWKIVVVRMSLDVIIIY